jgi:hypothetical protein
MKRLTEFLKESTEVDKYEKIMETFAKEADKLNKNVKVECYKDKGGHEIDTRIKMGDVTDFNEFLDKYREVFKNSFNKMLEYSASKMKYDPSGLYMEQWEDAWSNSVDDSDTKELVVGLLTYSDTQEEWRKVGRNADVWMSAVDDENPLYVFALIAGSFAVADTIFGTNTVSGLEKLVDRTSKKFGW